MTEAWPAEFLASNQRRWRTLSEAEWDAIRHDYVVGGFSARELCDRYEIGLSTLRQRARDGGWRRSDRPVDSDLFPHDADGWASPSDDPMVDSADAADWSGMAEVAKLRLRRAIVAGRAAEAASWMRLYDRLKVHDTPPWSEFDDDLEPEAAPTPAAPDLPAEPDADAVMMRTVRQIESVAVRAVRAAMDGDDDAMDALEAELTALEAQAEAIAPSVSPAPDEPASDSLDSLDPVFSSPPTIGAGDVRGAFVSPSLGP